MTPKTQIRLYDALKRIASYDSPERVRRDAEPMGLDENEAVEMAYENVIEEARSAIKGARRPVLHPNPPRTRRNKENVK